MEITEQRIRNTRTCHWQDARWFDQHFHVSRHRLIAMECDEGLRSMKRGTAKQGRRVWCVEDFLELTKFDRIPPAPPAMAPVHDEQFASDLAWLQRAVGETPDA